MKIRLINQKLMKSLVLTVMMLLSATMAWSQIPYNVWINNTRVTSENKADLSVIDGVTGTVTYNSTTKTLTLTDATIDYTYTSGQKEGALYIGNSDLSTIVVNGNCSITCTGAGGYGLMTSTGKIVTLKGSGKLTVKGPSAVYLSGIYSKFVVDGPTLVANGTASGAYGIGGYYDGGEYYSVLTVNSGNVEASGTTPGSSIGNLKELKLGEGMYIAEPAGAKFYNHKVTTSDGANIISTVRITSMLIRPLTLEAIADGTVTIKNPLQLSIGYASNGSPITWKNDATIEIPLSAGQWVELYGDNDRYYETSSKYTNIQCSSNCYIYGNIMSLVSSTNYSSQKELAKPYAFSMLFAGTNTTLRSHNTKRLLMPATTLTDFCYDHLFSGCQGLTIAPALPATTLAQYCYSYMFHQCFSLAKAPALPANTLAIGCYDHMFATCKYLETAPELPAEKLVTNCYNFMFAWCYKLNSVKCRATDITADACTDHWLESVETTGTFEKAAGFTGWTTGASGIPSGWTVKDNAKQPCGLSFSATEVTVAYGDNPNSKKPDLLNPNNLTPADITYTSSKPSVATVAPGGILTILSTGTTIITASYAGDDQYSSGSASYKLTVTSKGDAPVFEFDREGMIATQGKAATPPTLTMSDGLTATYSTSNSAVVSVNATTGALTINGKGMALITASTNGNQQYAPATASYMVMVVNNGSKMKGDVNGDGGVTAQDASIILQYVAGKITEW